MLDFAGKLQQCFLNRRLLLIWALINRFISQKTIYYPRELSKATLSLGFAMLSKKYAYFDAAHTDVVVVRRHVPWYSLVSLKTCIQLKRRAILWAGAGYPMEICLKKCTRYERRLEDNPARNIQTSGGVQGVLYSSAALQSTFLIFARRFRIYLAP